ncbi:unnamed protein product, partial [Closterium sp. NIES-53]
AGLPQRAEEVFAGLHGAAVLPTVPCFTALIGAHARVGQWREAQRAYDSIALMGLRPDMHSTTALLHALCTAGEVARARGVLEAMQRTTGAAPPPSCVTPLLAALARQGLWAEAEEVYASLAPAGSPPPVRWQHELLRAYERAGLPEKVQAHLALLRGWKGGDGGRSQEGEGRDDAGEERRRGRGSGRGGGGRARGRVDRTMLNCLAGAHGHAGDRAAMQRVLARMHGGEGAAWHVSSYNTVLAVLVHAADMAGAERLMDDMRAGGVAPDAATWTTLMGGYAEKKLLRKCTSVFRKMVAAGVRWDAGAVRVMLAACRSAEQQEEVRQLVESVVRKRTKRSLPSMAESLSPSAIAIRLASTVCHSTSPTRPTIPGLTPALRISSPFSCLSPRRPPFPIRLLAPRASRAFPRPPAALPADSVPSAASPPSTPQAPPEWRKLWAQLARKWAMRGRRWRWGLLDGYLARSMARPFAVAAGVAASVGVALGSLAEVARVAANTGAPLRLALLVALHHLPRFLALALPPACLAASLFAFSHLLAQSELAGMAAGGVAWGRLLRAPVCVGVGAGVLMLACHEHVVPWAMGRAQRMVEAAVTSDMASLPSQQHVLLREYGAHAQHHHDPLALLLAHLHPSSPHTTIASPPASSAGGAVAAAGKGGEGGGGGAGLWRVWYAGEVGGGAMRRVMLLHLAPQGHVQAVGPSSVFPFLSFRLTVYLSFVHNIPAPVLCAVRCEQVVAAERCEWQPLSRTWRLLNCCLLPLAPPACLPPTAHTMAPPSPQPPAEPLSTAPASHGPATAPASFSLLQLESLDVPLASALPSSSPLAAHAALPPACLPRHLLTVRTRHLRAQLAWLQRQAPRKGPRWGGRDERAVAEQRRREGEQRRRVGEQRRRVAEAESDLVLRDASCASCVAYAVVRHAGWEGHASCGEAGMMGGACMVCWMGGERTASRGAPFQLGLPLAAALHLLSATLAAAARSALLPPLLAAYLPLLLVLLLPPLLLGSHGASGEAEAGMRAKERGAEGAGDGEEAL